MAWINWYNPNDLINRLAIGHRLSLNNSYSWLDFGGSLQLGFVLVVWMLTFALIQREIRLKLPDGKKVLHPGKKKTDKPTTRGVLDTLNTISRVLWKSGKDSGSQIKNLNPDHQFLLDILGISNLYAGNSRGAT